MTVRMSGLLPGYAERLRSLERRDAPFDRCRRARRNGLRRQHLYQLAEIASRRSIRRPARGLPRSRRRRRRRDSGLDVGRRERSGWGSIATARSIKSIPNRAILRTIESNRFVPGSLDRSGELWQRHLEGD
jgi:hypothetical protein